MRGKVSHTRRPVQPYRITPAYAGKSQQLELKQPHFQDHPRLCGEKVHKQIHFRGHLGSPPPMRGKAEVLKSLGD